MYVMKVIFHDKGVEAIFFIHFFVFENLSQSLMACKKTPKKTCQSHFSSPLLAKLLQLHVPDSTDKSMTDFCMSSLFFKKSQLVCIIFRFYIMKQLVTHRNATCNVSRGPEYEKWWWGDQIIVKLA